MVKSLPTSAGDIGDLGSTPGSGRSPGKGNGNPLQYFCLENPMGRGAGWATVQQVPETQTQLKRQSVHTHDRRNRERTLA